MSQPFYIQVALISGDTNLIHDYTRVLNASNKFLLVDHFRNIPDVIAGSEKLENVNIVIFDAYTIPVNELEQLKDAFTSRKILVVDSGPEQVLKVLSLGVDGYLSKRDDYKVLLDSVRNVTNGGKAMDQKSLGHLFEVLGSDSNADVTLGPEQVADNM